jgi:RNA polymerase sigma-70 factor, ECF subfamily
MTTTTRGLRDARAKFYNLVWPHAAAVLRTAQFLTHSAADADDLAQETMLKAFRSIETLGDPQRVRPWLMTILRRARVDSHRHEHSHDRDVSLDQMALDPADDEHCDAMDVHELEADPDRALDELADQDVIRALKELPKDIRWTVLLVDVEGFDMNDASAVLDVPVGTVKSRLHRGRLMLKARLLESSAMVWECSKLPAKGSATLAKMAVTRLTLLPAPCLKP